MSGSSLNGEPEEDDGPEDTTADDLFQDLAETETGLGESADGDEIYEELAGESPEEIIAAADEAVEEHPVDDAILPDEDALDELLLSDRRMEEGFLWIDTGTDPDEESEESIVEDDVVDEWATAFAAASEVEPSDDEATEDSADEEDDDTAPEITIEVPDPDEVVGGETTTGDGTAETDDGESHDEESEDGESEDDRVFTFDDDVEEVAADSQLDAEDASDEEQPAVGEGDDEGPESEATDEADDDTDESDASPGLLARLLAAINPF